MEHALAEVLRLEAAIGQFVDVGLGDFERQPDWRARVIGPAYGHGD